ncbi:hypothetical protein [Rhodococcus sp. LB1]|uniref:hypothetical protein n=1 Tax=Rhodococcus sp. LB1 TaxID=1807499 RepID=UPI00077AE508|nr:hypothetical protein [Rhodococcus sp. LB1]KXX60605.1 hypothetical protein AZG88_37040 [Rhodococcus sp. LB1]
MAIAHFRAVHELQPYSAKLYFVIRASPERRGTEMSLLLTIALIALVLTVVWKHFYGLARFAGIILILKGLV